MTPGIFNFPKPFKRGDTFNGHSFEVSVKIAGVLTPVDFTGAVITIQLRREPGTNVVLQWLTSDGSITITGASNNKINMGIKTGAQMNIEPGKYKYDINVLFLNGVTNTYVSGYIVIVDDISREMDTTVIHINIPAPEPVLVNVTTPPAETAIIRSEQVLTPVIINPRPENLFISVKVIQPELTSVHINVSSIGEQGPQGPPGDLVSADILFSETPIGVVNGSNATFTSPLPFIPDKLNVFINGLLQKPVTHYQTSGPDTIIFSDSPQPPDEILLNYIKS